MASKVLPLAGLALVATAAILYPILLPRLKVFGLIGREYGEINNKQCTKIPTLRSCEDTWLHESSGMLYSACGNSIQDRMTWFPCNDHWDAVNRPGRDYLAVYDTRGTGSIEERTKHVKLQGFSGLYGEGSFTSHGMGAWVDPTPGSDRIRLFLVNHRPTIDPVTQALVLDENTGANSTIEIFETTVGSDTAQHIRTVAHPLLRTPNDVDGLGPDSFYVTNDHHIKRGKKKALDMFMPWTEVIFCDESHCKVAMEGLTFANGIAKAGDKDDIFYISSTASDKFYVVQSQADKSLVILDSVSVPYATDNVWSSPSSGAAYIAAFPNVQALTGRAFKNPATQGAHSAVIKVSKNIGSRDAFFGEKYKVEMLFEDDEIEGGDSPSGITGMAVDEAAGRLYLASLYQEWMYECKLTEVPRKLKV